MANLWKIKKEAGKGKHWDFIGLCYPGTKARVTRIKDKEYRVELFLTDDQTGTELEQERSPSRAFVASLETWKTLAGAKNASRRVLFNPAWLEEAGVRFRREVTEQEVVKAVVDETRKREAAEEAQLPPGVPSF